MNDILIILLLIGFFIPICKIYDSKENIKNIKKFRNLLLEFRKELEFFPENKDNINNILSELLQNLFLYESSITQVILFNDKYTNRTTWITENWLMNIEYFFENTKNYPFDILSTKVKYSINECDTAIGKNLAIIKKAERNLFPIFYFNNIINEVWNIWFNNTIFNNSSKHTRSINIFEFVGFVANITAIITFISSIIKFVFSFFKATHL